MNYETMYHCKEYHAFSLEKLIFKNSNIADVFLKVRLS